MGVIKTNFLGNDVPKKRYALYLCCLHNDSIDSVMRIDKKNHLQIYLEKCKYRVKKIQMFRFINIELKSDSDSDSEPEKLICFDLLFSSTLL